MDEYIKRKDAISAVCFGCNLEFSERPCEPPDCEIRHAINAVPAADVVEVVRCKDCCFGAQHPTSDEWKICTNGQWNTEYYPLVCDNDFCSYGRRKDEISKATDS